MPHETQHHRQPPVYQHLQTETVDGLHVITLNRPEKLNAVNRVLEDELPAAANAASADESVRCVMITGAGRGFCAGLELDPKNIGRILKGESRADKLDDLAWVGRWALAISG